MKKIIKKIIDWLSLIVIGSVVIYCFYSLASEGSIVFIPKRAALSLLCGIVNAVILAYLTFKRPNRLAD